MTLRDGACGCLSTPSAGSTRVPGVTLAPTVLILAAGQGTRMRSKTPKVLHELCGRPMVLWPVQAALEAGAERVVVVDSPARALEGVLPEGVELAVQPQSNGTGARSSRRWPSSIPRWTYLMRTQLRWRHPWAPQSSRTHPWWS